MKLASESHKNSADSKQNESPIKRLRKKQKKTFFDPRTELSPKKRLMNLLNAHRSEPKGPAIRLKLNQFTTLAANEKMTLEELNYPNDQLGQQIPENSDLNTQEKKITDNRGNGLTFESKVMKKVNIPQFESKLVFNKDAAD